MEKSEIKSFLNEWRIGDGYEIYANLTNEEIIDHMSNIFDESKTDILGKTVNSNPSFLAYMNSVSPDMSDEGKFAFMGESYFLTAKTMLDICIEQRLQGKAQNKLIYPILFNLIHGIELYLKSITSLCYLSNDIETNIPRGHNINSLVEDLIKFAVNNNDDDLLSNMRVVKRFADDIYSKTTLMDFARYPLDNHGNCHFYCHYKDTKVNIATLQKWIGILEIIFSGSVWYYSDKYNNI